MPRKRGFYERVTLPLCAALFGALNFIPGLLTNGSYADAQYGGGGGGGGGGTTACTSQNEGQVVYSFVCGGCYVVSCTPLPCHNEAAYEGTRISHTCHSGQWQEGWSSVPCGQCFP